RPSWRPRGRRYSTLLSSPFCSSPHVLPSRKIIDTSYAAYLLMPRPSLWLLWLLLLLLLALLWARLRPLHPPAPPRRHRPFSHRRPRRPHLRRPIDPAAPRHYRAAFAGRGGARVDTDDDATPLLDVSDATSTWRSISSISSSSSGELVDLGLPPHDNNNNNIPINIYNGNASTTDPAAQGASDAHVV
ncbi:hypothetical protein C8J57DRAFT_1636644, partial [Mycena rebaudengoi]